MRLLRSPRSIGIASVYSFLSPSLASRVYVGLKNEAYLYQQTLTVAWQKCSLTRQPNELLHVNTPPRRSLYPGKLSSLPQLLLCPEITKQMPLKCLTPDGHLHLIERIFRNIICIKLINLSHDIVHIRLLRLREQQKLSSADRLKACHSKESRFKHLQSCSLRRRDAKLRGSELFRYRVHSVDVLAR